MHRWTAVPLLVIACVLVSGSADAKPAAMDFGRTLKALNGTITVPPEWDGIWNTLDSTYDCAGPLRAASAGEDTICGGEPVTADDPGPWTFSCSGSANGNTIDVTCTGGGELLPDCQITLEVHMVATRTGNSFRSVTTVNSTYSGAGEGCDVIPDDCTRIVSEGTRKGPAPSEYCTTPVRRSTWGRLKSIYR